MRSPSRFSASFEFVVVAAGVVGTFVAVVLVDEDAFLAGDPFAAVLTPVLPATQDEEPENRSGEELGDSPPEALTGACEGQASRCSQAGHGGDQPAGRERTAIVGRSGGFYGANTRVIGV